MKAYRYCLALFLTYFKQGPFSTMDDSASDLQSSETKDETRWMENVKFLCQLVQFVQSQGTQSLRDAVPIPCTATVESKGEDTTAAQNGTNSVSPHPTSTFYKLNSTSLP